jgi:hypothetical protein
MAKQPYKMTKLSEIRPYDRNPRIIPQAAVDAVAKSIRAFGFRQPIVVDGDGVILAGHTRYKAAQQLGLTEVPVVWQVDITPIQARGYRIADNKTAEIAAWDRDALDAEIKDIAGHTDADLDALGLSSWELDRILHECADAGLPEDNAGERACGYAATVTPAPAPASAPTLCADADTATANLQADDPHDGSGGRAGALFQLVAVFDTQTAHDDAAEVLAKKFGDAVAIIE